MDRGRRARWAWAVVGALLATARVASAGDERVLVVDVTPSASELGAEKMRALVGDELRARTVPPGDPRASAAKGTVTIDVDPRAGELSVTYLAHASPIVRRVPLPPDVSSARTAAVTLAGNLGRDEASELVVELRKQRAPLPPATLEAHVASPDETPGPSAVDAARLQATLDRYAREDRRAVITYAWSMGITGAVGIGVGATLLAQNEVSAGLAIGGVGLALALSGALIPFDETPFERLAAYDRGGAGLMATEARWRRAAQNERLARYLSGTCSLVGGVLSLGLGAFDALDSSLTNGRAARYGFASFFLAAGAVEAIAGAHVLITEGRIESALQAYEESSGRRASPSAAAHARLRVAALAGGAMGVVSGTF